MFLANPSTTAAKAVTGECGGVVGSPLANLLFLVGPPTDGFVFRPEIFPLIRDGDETKVPSMSVMLLALTLNK